MHNQQEHLIHITHKHKPKNNNHSLFSIGYFGVSLFSFVNHDSYFVNVEFLRIDQLI